MVRIRLSAEAIYELCRHLCWGSGAQQ